MSVPLRAPYTVGDAVAHFTIGGLEVSIVTGVEYDTRTGWQFKVATDQGIDVLDDNDIVNMYELASRLDDALLRNESQADEIRDLEEALLTARKELKARAGE